MPTFDFRCDTCFRVFEDTIPFQSKKKPACPECKGKKVKKLLIPPMVLFKGPGFYVTDKGKSAVIHQAEKNASGEQAESKPVEKVEASPKIKAKKPDSAKNTNI
ncbi:MAG: hypothetical protein JWM56_1222 [Candidatus Peribacteria bacterium]|nr:hypothetical protein [Candidatus Peribacteria bacterium]